MKMMKRVLALVAIAVMMLTMAACGNKADMTDSEYVIDKGVLVVGITDFAPMDYQDENGNWIGYDADLAKAFAKELGVEAKFQVIEWGKKAMELDGKTIDVVWNGMTLNDEVKAAMSTSDAYLKNAQVVVMKKDKVANFATVESMKDLQFAVEDGSAGEDVATENNLKTTPVLDQAKALMEVNAGTADAAIIDLLMAGAMIGEGTSYADLAFSLELTSEEYGIGFRKESDLTAKLNDFLKKAYDDGTMTNLAKTYGISNENIIAQ
jgi:polar amino acid transport system substrate-binding protein